MPEDAHRPYDIWKGDYEQQHSMDQDDFQPNLQQLPFCGEAKT